MQKLILTLVIFLSGCAVAPVEKIPAPIAPVALKTFPAAQAVEQLARGILRTEAQTQAGGSVVVGYETDDNKVKAIVIKNPYKTAILEKNNKRYEIDYYLTHIYKADGAVTDDELTPVVFEGGRLAGKGWEFLNKLK